jgi:hypothetical protein
MGVGKHDKPRIGRAEKVYGLNIALHNPHSFSFTQSSALSTQHSALFFQHSALFLMTHILRSRNLKKRQKKYPQIKQK